MSKIKTLFCIKMEKNFIAQEKGYPRKPYEAFSLVALGHKLMEEVLELEEAILKLDMEGAKIECADVSNVVDYLFEKLMNMGNPSLKIEDIEGEKDK